MGFYTEEQLRVERLAAAIEERLIGDDENVRLAENLETRSLGTACNEECCRHFLAVALVFTWEGFDKDAVGLLLNNGTEEEARQILILLEIMAEPVFTSGEVTLLKECFGRGSQPFREIWRRLAKKVGEALSARTAKAATEVTRRLILPFPYTIPQQVTAISA